MQRNQDRINLKNENCQNGICIVGNSIKDSVDNIKNIKNTSKKIFKKYSLNENDYIYCTIHRSENVDFPIRLKKIINIIKYFSKIKKVIIPVHPRVKNKFKKLKFYNIEKVIFTDPLKFSESIDLLSKCYFHFLIQVAFKRNLILKKKCLVPLDFTPHNYYIDKNANNLIQLNTKNYYKKIRKFLNNDKKNKIIKKFNHPKNIGTKIVKIINKKLKYD